MPRTDPQRLRARLCRAILHGKRRLPAADYLIAAAAAERGAGVLHYDRHFDTLCGVLGIESVWIAEPGSIG
ncbi:MAG TPA: hypothetical protein VG053_04055 [Solirubrobacteraceae bacterium]|nr:hypothetical protein [Solirubrobacteraceae bacterium]